MSPMRATHMQIAWSDGSGLSDFNELLGHRVRLHGLRARPELNGQVGRVYSFDHEKGRAGVYLDSGGNGLWVRPSNCQVDEAQSELQPAAETPSSSASADVFVELAPVLMQQLSAPISATFSAADSMSALWKQICATPLGTEEAMLMAACKQLWPELARDPIKAMICTHVGDGRTGELVGELHATAQAKIDAIGQKLPADRRKALLAEAADKAEHLRQVLRAVEAQIDAHRTGGPLLIECARSLVGSRTMDGAPSLPCVSPQPSLHLAHTRGKDHEANALEWARARWGGACVAVPSCTVVAGASGGAVGPRLKGEFDVLVLSSNCSSGGVEGPVEGVASDAGAVASSTCADVASPPGSAVVGSASRLVAIVEAKAGPEGFSDVRKMLATRRALLKPGATLTVCQRHAAKRSPSSSSAAAAAASPSSAATAGDKGESQDAISFPSALAEGETRMVHIDPATPPHIAYVYGCGGSFGQIVRRSVGLTLSHVLLERALALAAADGDSGAVFERVHREGGEGSDGGGGGGGGGDDDDGGGGGGGGGDGAGAEQQPLMLRVEFPAAAVEEQQVAVSAFEEEVTDLAARGLISFWGHG